MVLKLWVLGLFGCVALSCTTAAQAELLTWSRASTPDGIFSVETTCDSNEIEAFREIPDKLANGLTFKRQSRVLCLQDKLMFVAGVVKIRGASKDKTAFEILLGELSKGAEADQQLVSQIDGHNALVSREAANGVTAQSTYVELDAERLILLIAGYEPGTRAGQSEQKHVVDRFTRSLRITNK